MRSWRVTERHLTPTVRLVKLAASFGLIRTKGVPE
jgi:hypothetical protein